MNPNYKSDLIIIGGGIAGLSLAILMVRQGYKVLVIEKANYPRHKVCGEYVSMESWDFLIRLGLPLDKMDLPVIDTFRLSFPSGKMLSCPLKTGGFGISRYTFDQVLANLALQCGVQLNTGEKVTNINAQPKEYLIATNKQQSYTAQAVVGAYGRNPGPGENSPRNGKQEYVGVKYHILTDLASNIIEINAFSGGYCGISRVEKDRFCFCYLTKAEALKIRKGNIPDFEEEILARNPRLKDHLRNCRRIAGPFVTSHFNFAYQGSFRDDLFFSGDAAGFIPPLTGNGMSLALRSAHTLSLVLKDLLEGRISREKAAEKYAGYGTGYLKGRIQKGIVLQELLLQQNRMFQNLLFGSMKYVPGLMPFLVGQATGKAF